jgi:hypothetical protein
MGAGFYLLGILHLTLHAIFKSLLFLGAGGKIHRRWGEQMKRKIISSSLATRRVIQLSTLSLMGIPFMSGLFSKDLFLTHLNFSPLILLFSLTVGGTYLYSLPLLSRRKGALSQGVVRKKGTLSYLLLLGLIFLMVSLFLGEERGVGAEKGLPLLFFLLLFVFLYSKGRYLNYTSIILKEFSKGYESLISYHLLFTSLPLFLLLS